MMIIFGLFEFQKNLRTTLGYLWGKVKVDKIENDEYNDSVGDKDQSVDI
jgi:hypothetical protein